MKRIYWGVLLVVAAVLLLLGSFGVNLGFIGSLPLFPMLVLVLVIGICIGLAVDHTWPALPFPLAIGFFFIEKDLAEYLGKPDGDIVSNWLVLGCAILLSIGIALLTPHRIKGVQPAVKSSESRRLCSETKYIDCRNFREYRYMLRMGDAHLYFSNVENYVGGGTLYVSNKMANLVIDVPRGWSIYTDIKTSMGDTSTPNEIFVGGPVLNIIGENKMGELVIRYCG